MHRLQMTIGVFLGCTLLGLGIGILADAAGAGTIIGLGVGFLMSGVLATVKR